MRNSRLLITPNGHFHPATMYWPLERKQASSLQHWVQERRQDLRLWSSLVSWEFDHDWHNSKKNYDKCEKLRYGSPSDQNRESRRGYCRKLLKKPDIMMNTWNEEAEEEWCRRSAQAQKGQRRQQGTVGALPVIVIVDHRSCLQQGTKRECTYNALFKDIIK